MRKYAIYGEALRDIVIDPIESTGIVSAYKEYDVDSIADECIDIDDNAQYYQAVDCDDFWDIVEKYDRGPNLYDNFKDCKNEELFGYLDPEEYDIDGFCERYIVEEDGKFFIPGVDSREFWEHAEEFAL